MEDRIITADSALYGGQLSDYFPDGRLRLVAQVKDGKLHGNSKEFYESGQLRFIRNFNNGSLCCVITEYFPNGELKMQGVVGPQTACGGNMITDMLYAYYNNEKKYVNKVKNRARIVFINQAGLSSFFNTHLPLHEQAGYRIYDNSREDYGIFIEDSRKILAPAED